jgi:nucleotide-binding universal stress UspA family protein
MQAALYARILLPTDGAEASQRAILGAVELAKALGADVVGMTATPAFHVVTTDAAMLEDTPGQFAAASRALAGRRLADVERAARAAGVPFRLEHIVSDDPAGAILACAQHSDCGLIAMASQGHGGLRALLLGSTTRAVLAHSDLPVLVYRPRERHV